MENFCQLGKIEQKKIKDLSGIILDPTEEGLEETVVYEVCRGEQEKETSGTKIRYDLTKIYPGKIKNEYPKTFGHYHSLGFVELFEVLEGEGYTLLQKENGKAEKIKEFYVVENKVGDKVIIPPGFTFTNINRGNVPLILSNWIDERVENKYENIKEFKGLAYYVVFAGSPALIKNSHYQEAPEAIWLRPKRLPAELEDLNFLTEPEKYKKTLTIDSLYQKI